MFPYTSESAEEFKKMFAVPNEKHLACSNSPLMIQNKLISPITRHYFFNESELKT